jgi:hypothetical protein
MYIPTFEVLRTRTATLLVGLCILFSASAAYAGTKPPWDCFSKAEPERSWCMQGLSCAQIGDCSTGAGCCQFGDLVTCSNQCSACKAMWEGVGRFNWNCVREVPKDCKKAGATPSCTRGNACARAKSCLECCGTSDTGCQAQCRACRPFIEKPNFPAEPRCFQVTSPS